MGEPVTLQLGRHPSQSPEVVEQMLIGSQCLVVQHSIDGRLDLVLQSETIPSRVGGFRCLQPSIQTL